MKTTLLATALIAATAFTSLGCRNTRIERRYTEDTTQVGADQPKEGDRRPGRESTSVETSDPTIIIE